ncbi:MAG: SsrA-binding protein SmpB [Candidatus Brocadiaceae bacterium]|jgi:SsrA-binding protein
MAKSANSVKIVATNRRARHDYEIEDTYEAGLVLQGTEVKSLRQGNCSISEAFARPRADELYLIDMHIAPYEAGNVQNHDPKRPRKLLLHRREMDRVISQCTQRGYTLIPLSVYFKGGYAKVEIALARRRKQWDKRRQKEERQRREDTERELRRRRR